MRQLLALLNLLLATALLGCGADPLADRAAKGKIAEESLNAGLQAYQSKDFETAAAQLKQACDAGTLILDLQIDARLKRAVALAHLGQFDVALGELAELEKGAPHLEHVYAARSFVFKKQGKQAEALAEFARAKKLSPSIQPISE